MREFPCRIAWQLSRVPGCLHCCGFPWQSSQHWHACEYEMESSPNKASYALPQTKQNKCTICQTGSQHKIGEYCLSYIQEEDVGSYSWLGQGVEFAWSLQWLHGFSPGTLVSPTIKTCLRLSLLSQPRILELAPCCCAVVAQISLCCTGYGFMWQ